MKLQDRAVKLRLIPRTAGRGREAYKLRPGNAHLWISEARSGGDDAGNYEKDVLSQATGNWEDAETSGNRVIPWGLLCRASDSRPEESELSPEPLGPESVPALGPSHLALDESPEASLERGSWEAGGL